MRPVVENLAIAANIAGFVDGTRRSIRADVDARYRRGLREAVAQDGGGKAGFLIRNSLDAGPSRGGVAETMAYFGDGLTLKLAYTAQIVDGLEIVMPGFKRWLEMTGFGNDKTMIRGFVAWSEHTQGKGRVMSGVKDTAERNA